MDAQNYANHRHRPVLWLIAALSAVIGLSLILLLVMRELSLTNVVFLLVGFSLVCVMWMVRQYALRLQDRIIRLEMQARLARLGRAADFGRLTVPQIVALRFASDAELPALMDRAAAESLTADQIKRAVTTWQADHMRT